MKSEAVDICESFFRTYFEERDVQNAALFLAGDVFWFGDGASDMADTREKAMRLMERGANLMDYRNQAILALDLGETARLAADIRHVAGSMLLYDCASCEENAYGVSIVLKRAGRSFAIRQVHMHALGPVGRLGMDRRLEAAYANLPCGLAVLEQTEAGLRALYFNDTLCHMFGFSRGEFPANPLLAALADAGRREGVYEGARRDGGAIRLKVGLRCVERGELSLLYATVHDATGEFADPVSQLPNSQSFYGELSKRLPAAAGGSCALAIARIDNLDQLLLSHGRAAFAECVRKAAETVRASAHRGELCCRMSTDEFAIFYPAMPDERALSERLRLIAAGMRRDDGKLRVTASVGGALLPASDAAEALLLRATAALRWAWGRGGDDFAVFRPEMLIRRGQSAPAARDGIPARVFVRTFGHFDVFLEGKPVLFSSAKAKELLALLVDRTGGFVTANEAITILWENESINNTTLARYRKIAMRLKAILDSNGIGDIVEVIRGNRRIVAENVDCDYYDFISANSKKAHMYAGSYLIEYSWAEETNAVLDQKRYPKGDSLRIM